jgi:hypothetical protein
MATAGQLLDQFSSGGSKSIARIRKGFLDGIRPGDELGEALLGQGTLGKAKPNANSFMNPAADQEGIISLIQTRTLSVACRASRASSNVGIQSSSG